MPNANLTVYVPQSGCGGVFNPTIWRCIHTDTGKLNEPLRCGRFENKYCDLRCGFLHIEFYGKHMRASFGCRHDSTLPYTTITVLNEDPPIV